MQRVRPCCMSRGVVAASSIKLPKDTTFTSAMAGSVSTSAVAASSIKPSEDTTLTSAVHESDLLAAHMGSPNNHHSSTWCSPSWGATDGDEVAWSLGSITGCSTGTPCRRRGFGRSTTATRAVPGRGTPLSRSHLGLGRSTRGVGGANSAARGGSRYGTRPRGSGSGGRLANVA